MQVSELVKEYKREHLTVWGNASSEIVDKCYKEVSLGFDQREGWPSFVW